MSVLVIYIKCKAIYTNFLKIRIKLYNKVPIKVLTLTDKEQKICYSIY